MDLNDHPYAMKTIAFTGRRTFWLAFLCIVLSILEGAAPLPFAQVTGAQFDNARLEQLRGLKFKSPVPVVALKPEEAQRVIEADLKRDYSDERLWADGTAASLVGLAPPQFDLKQETLKQALTQFGGVYSDHLKEIVLMARGVGGMPPNISWFSFQSGFLGSRLAHELTHALQDQNLGLEAKQEQLKDETDQSVAFDSVVEGDATLAGVGYAADGLDTNVVNRLVSNLDGMTRRLNTWAADNNVPEALYVPGIFAHTEGIKFVAEVYRRGGWPAVDALYTNRPVSSQQIMNPQLYFEHESPARIRLDGYHQLLPSAVAVHTDTFGELFLRVILERNLGATSAYTNLAQRWAGDRMVILKQGSSITVLWMLAFSDPSSAAQFAAVYSSVLDRVHGSSTSHRVESRGNSVLAIVGDGYRAHPDLPAQIWQQTTITPASKPRTH